MVQIAVITCYRRDRLPSLKEVDIVELVEFDGELEGGLQVAHGASEGRARARAARRAMPRPLAGRPHRAAPTAARGTHCTCTTTPDTLRTPRDAWRDARGASRARSSRAHSDTQPPSPTYGSQCGNQEFIF